MKYRVWGPVRPCPSNKNLVWSPFSTAQGLPRSPTGRSWQKKCPFEEDMKRKSEAKHPAHIFNFFESSRLEAIFKPKHGSEAHFQTKAQFWSPRSSQDAILEPIFTQKRRSGPYFRAKKIMELIFAPKRRSGAHFHTKTLCWILFSYQNAGLVPIFMPGRNSGPPLQHNAASEVDVTCKGGRRQWRSR